MRIDRARIKAWLPWRVRRPLVKIRNVVHYRPMRRAPLQTLRYLLFDRELNNFTYELDNEAELAAFIGDALDAPHAEVTRLIDELQQDGELRAAIETKLRARPDRNRRMPYGRRLGWYAATRLRRPAVVIETGIHDGLGSAILLRALQRNAGEGFDGRLISFDVREDVGWLVPDWLRSRNEVHIGDALAGLPPAVGDRRVDVFIHDSDHRYAHETAEFEAVLKLSSDAAVLMSDNAHGSSAMADFCDRHHQGFKLFRERPRGHFYAGAGLGLTVLSNVPDRDQIVR